MDIQPMSGEILSAANTMIRESLLPDFPTADFNSSRMGITAFYQLNRPLQGNVSRRSKEQVHVVGHQHKSMQAEFPLPAIAIKSLQEKSRIRFDDKESSTLKRREGHETGSRRRHQSRRFHGAGPQCLKPCA